MPPTQRPPRCDKTVREIERLFPSFDHPLPVCSLCPLLRSDKEFFYCGQIERVEGGYVNRAMPGPREVRLARGVVVDGEAIPKGTVLHMVASAASERVWCRRSSHAKGPRHEGRGKYPIFLLARSSLDFGNKHVRVPLHGTVRKFLSTSVLIGKCLLPTKEISEVWLVDGTNVGVHDLRPWHEIGAVKIPVWLAQEKGLLTQPVDKSNTEKGE